MPRHASPVATLLGLVGSIAIVVGTFLPWARSRHGDNIKGFEGFDGFLGSAGFFTIVLGLCGVAVTLANIATSRLGKSAGASTILVGLVGAGLAVLQMVHVQVQIGIGLYLLAAGGLALLAAGAFHLTFKAR